MPQFEIVATASGKRLRVVGPLPGPFHGEQHGGTWLCPLDAANAAALRTVLQWTAPVPVGHRKSIGCGDRLGLATVGHLQAVRSGDMFPVLAQQSPREMSRSRRSAQAVLDDATWGVLEDDWHSGFGCDADHLKNTAAIDDVIAAGFVGFTLDPGDHVDNVANADPPAVLQDKYAALPWDRLDTSPEALLERYAGASPVGSLDTLTVWRAACKYASPLAEAAALARHIAWRMGGRSYDLEVSVDETETPTSPAEHYFIASELLRLGVRFQGLAPRFVGRFEKGVDYIGDLGAFEDDFARHARIARELGPYKLSIHSGSDKFSIYPIIARHAGEYVHLKTAGTSWLEALRVVADCDPELFRDMLRFAIDHYPQEKASYHVSADVTRIEHTQDAALPTLLDRFDARQVLHVAFGSLIDTFRERLFPVLRAHEAEYHALIKRHFERHIQPFRA